jgi:hypothetical protein
MRYLLEYITRGQLSLIECVTAVFIVRAWEDSASWLVILGILAAGWLTSTVCEYLGTMTGARQ